MDINMEEEKSYSLMAQSLMVTSLMESMKATESMKEKLISTSFLTKIYRVVQSWSTTWSRKICLGQRQRV